MTIGGRKGRYMKYCTKNTCWGNIGYPLVKIKGLLVCAICLNPRKNTWGYKDGKKVSRGKNR